MQSRGFGSLTFSRPIRQLELPVSVAVRKTKKQITGWVKRKGKIVLNAGAKQLSKVKSLNQLKKKLDDFRLKRAWVKKTSKYIELWGEFNPKVLLMKTDADGNQEFEVRDLTTGHRKLLNNVDDGLSNTKKEVGRSLSADELIVSDSFAETFKKTDAKEQAELFNELKKLDPEEVRKRMGGSNPPAWLDDPDIPDKVKEVYYKRSDLNKKMNPTDGQNSHHINPIESLGNNKVLQDAVDNGFDYNNIENGINLERYSSKLDTPGASPNGTHASHPNYTKSVDKIHNKFETQFINTGRYNPQIDAKRYIEVFSEKLKLKLDEFCSPGAKDRVKVDELFDKKVNIDTFYKDIITEFYKRKNNAL